MTLLVDLADELDFTTVDALERGAARATPAVAGGTSVDGESLRGTMAGSDR